MIDKLKSFSTDTLFMLVAGFAVSYLFQWWAIVPVFILLAIVLKISAGQAFAAGFVAASALWGMYANYLDMANLSLLSAKVGQVFQGLTTPHLLWLTSSIGGTLGGFAALTGSTFRSLVWKNL